MSQQQQTIDLTTVSDEDFVRKNIPETIRVPLEELEIAAVALERSKAEKLLAELEGKFDDVKAEWKEKIGRQEVLVEKHKRTIDDRMQDSAVVCHEVWTKGTIALVHADTGRVIKTRPPTQAELQRHLPNTGTSSVLDQAAAAQKASNSQEDEDGDVVPDDGSDEVAAKRRKRK